MFSLLDIVVPLSGPSFSLPDGGSTVHQVHPGIQEAGRVLFSDSASSETNSVASCLGWDHGKVRR